MGGASLFDASKTGGEKRKRARQDDPSDVEGYQGEMRFRRIERM